MQSHQFSDSHNRQSFTPVGSGDFLRSSVTPDEMIVMKEHAQIGANILAKPDHEIMQCASRIAAAHHEKWDGTGYPRGLKGEEIPLEGRITALADVYDALRSKRPYKPAFSHEKSMNIMLEGDGRTSPDHFDPALLRILEEQAHKFDAVFNRLAD